MGKRTKFAANQRQVMGWGDGVDSDMIHAFDAGGLSLCGQVKWGDRLLVSSPSMRPNDDYCGPCQDHHAALRPWERLKPHWRKQDEGLPTAVLLRGQRYEPAVLLPPGMQVNGHSIPWPTVHIAQDLWVVTFSQELGPAYVVVGHLATWMSGSKGVGTRKLGKGSKDLTQVAQKGAP